MAASGRSEAEAKALFDGGVKLEIPFTTKIDSVFEPVVKELKQAVSGGNMKTRGYRATFIFFPGGRLDASKKAGFSRGSSGAGAKKYVKLSVYSTFVEADGRKYRDAVAYAESNFRAPKPKPVPDDQRKEQQDQEATAAAEYKRKATLRHRAPEKEEDPKAKQKRVDAVEQAAAAPAAAAAASSRCSTSSTSSSATTTTTTTTTATSSSSGSGPQQRHAARRCRRGGRAVLPTSSCSCRLCHGRHPQSRQACCRSCW